MFAIPAPIASDYGVKSGSGMGTLIVRPTTRRGENAEVLDLDAARYVSDLAQRENHSVATLLSSRIDEIFSTAKNPEKPTWTKVEKPRPAKHTVPEFPTLGKPVKSATIPKWGAKMTTLSREVNEQIGQDKVDERDFQKREKDYIEEIAGLKRTIKNREDLLDEIDGENAGLRNAVDELERELAWNRDKKKNNID